MPNFVHYHLLLSSLLTSHIGKRLHVDQARFAGCGLRVAEDGGLRDRIVVLIRRRDRTT